MAERSTSEAQHTTATPDAAVIANGPVTLYKDGVTVEVLGSSVEAMLAAGWLLGSPEEIPALMGEIELLLGEVGRNLRAYVAGAQADGSIDPQDEATYGAAHSALQRFSNRAADLDRLVHAVYPVRQAAAVETPHPEAEGGNVAHDPGQIAMRDPEGNFRAIDPGAVEKLVGFGWEKI